jgi:hypothetical protein
MFLKILVDIATPHRTDVMQSRTDNRLSGNFAMNPAIYNAAMSQYCLPGNPYAPLQKGERLERPLSSASAGAHTTPEDMAAAFGQLSVNGYSANGAVNNGIYGMQNVNAMPYNSGAVHYRLRDGRMIPSQIGGQQSTYSAGNDAMSLQAQYMSYANGNGIQAAQVIGWNGVQQYHRDMPVPDLAAPRRSSLSSNEENGPHTPFFGAATRTDFQPKAGLADSPNPWTTPSPQQLAPQFYPDQLMKSPNGQYVRMNLDDVCMQDPPIPKPVPAIFSGEKGRGTLEKSLQNNLNTTNVYVRGLHPNTTDDMLRQYGLRFGDIVSAKSMLDQETGNCKG